MALNVIKVTQNTEQSLSVANTWTLIPGTTTAALTSGVPYLVIGTGQFRTSPDGSARGGLRLESAEIYDPPGSYYRVRRILDSDGSSYNVYMCAFIYTPTTADTWYFMGTTSSTSFTAYFDVMNIVCIPLDHVTTADYKQQYTYTALDVDTTYGTWTDGQSLTWTPATASHDWLILASATWGPASTNASYYSRLNWSGGISGASPHHRQEVNVATWELLHTQTAEVRNLAASSHTVKYQFALETGSPTTEHVDGQIIIAVDLDEIFESHGTFFNSGTVSLSSSAYGTEVANVDFTPTTSGDVLVFGAYHIPHSGTSEYTGRLQQGGSDLNTGVTSQANELCEAIDNSDEEWVILMGFDLSAPASSRDYDMDASDTSGSTSASYRSLAAMSLIEPGGGAGAPAAPTNLQVAAGTKPSDTEVQLTWTDNATDELRYELERKKAAESYEVIPYAVDLPGTVSDYISTPDHSTLDLVGSLDIRMLVSADAWVPGAASALLAKWGASGQRSYALVLRTDGKLGLHLSADSTTDEELVSSAATGFTAGTVHWIRAWYDDATQLTRFYTSNQTDRRHEDVTWSELGTAQATTAAQIFASTAALTLGVRNAAEPFAGQVHAAVVKPSPALTHVAYFAAHDVDGWNVAQTIYTDSTVKAWTLNGSAAVVDLPANSTSWWDNFVDPDVTDYSYRVRASNASGDSNYATLSPVRTAPARPTTVSVLQTTGYGFQVQLSIPSESLDNEARILWRQNGTTPWTHMLQLSYLENSNPHWITEGISTGVTYDITAISGVQSIDLWSGLAPIVTQQAAGGIVTAPATDGVKLGDYASVGIITPEEAPPAESGWEGAAGLAYPPNVVPALEPWMERVRVTLQNLIAIAVEGPGILSMTITLDGSGNVFAVVTPNENTKKVRLLFSTGGYPSKQEILDSTVEFAPASAGETLTTTSLGTIAVEQWAYVGAVAFATVDNSGRGSGPASSVVYDQERRDSADDLGAEPEIHTATTPPTDLDKLWLDISANPYVLRRWDGAEWVAARIIFPDELLPGSLPGGTTVDGGGTGTQPIARGYQTGTTRHGLDVSFSPAYENTPTVQLHGGIKFQGDSTKWSGTYSATKAQYEDMAAESLSETGFTTKAQLRQKGSVTAQSDDFPSGNNLTYLGAVTDVTLNPGDSVNDNYTVHYKVTLNIPCPPVGETYSCHLSVQIRTWDGLKWVTRAAQLYTAKQYPVPNCVLHGWSHEQKTITVAGLGLGDKIRLEIGAWGDGTPFGTATFGVHGFNVSNGDPANGVTYSTDTGEITTSMTPDTDDYVIWEAWEIAT